MDTVNAQPDKSTAAEPITSSCLAAEPARSVAVHGFPCGLPAGQLGTDEDPVPSDNVQAFELGRRVERMLAEHRASAQVDPHDAATDAYDAARVLDALSSVRKHSPRGFEISREHAAQLLHQTGHDGRLSGRERTAVLRHFRAPSDGAVTDPTPAGGDMHGAAALSLITRSRLAPAVRLELLGHLAELIAAHDAWLTARAGEWVARERV
jgi:hypothetical protein